MKTIKYLTMAALALLTAACSSDDNELAQQPTTSNGMVTITAKLAPKTGTTRALELGQDGEGKDIVKVTWAKDEQMAILYGGSYNSTATITEVDETTGEATISFNVDGKFEGSTCKIIYPASAVNQENRGLKDNTMLLSIQDGTLDANLDIRVGAGIIHTSTPSLDVTTQPAAQFAIFELNLQSDGSNISAKQLYITSDGVKYTIVPTSATNQFYVALPPISGKEVTFKAYAGNNVYKFTKSGVTFAANKFYQSTLSLTNLGADDSSPNSSNHLNGLFSVSATKEVYFSPANLEFQTQSKGTWTTQRNDWVFMRGASREDYGHQYDVVEQNGLVAVDYKEQSRVGLFGWGTSYFDHGANVIRPWYTSTENSDYYAYGDASKNLFDGTGEADWGYNKIYGGGNKENIWRTLTSDEWTYLINKNGDYSKRLVRVNGEYKVPCGLGKIGEVNGLILLPDNWDGTVDADFEHYKSGATFNDNSYTTAEWQTMEAAGVVFLPAAGTRKYSPSTSANTVVEHVNKTGYYWTSSVSSEMDYRFVQYVSFEEGNIYFGRTDRDNGSSVRLVYKLPE